MNSKANSQFLLTFPFPFPHRLSLFLGPKLFSDPSFSYKLQFRKQCNSCPCSHHQCFCFRSQLGRPSKRVCCVCLLLINLTNVTLHLQSSSYFSVFFSVFHLTLVTQSDSVVFAYSWPRMTKLTLHLHSFFFLTNLTKEAHCTEQSYSYWFYKCHICIFLMDTVLLVRIFLLI